MATNHLKGLEIALKALFNVATAPVGTPQLRYMKTTYVPNGDNSYWSDISADEASGAPTITISGLSIGMDTTNNRVEVDFTDPSTPNITTTTNQFAIIIWTGVAATSPIVYSGSINTTLTPTDGTLSLTLNAEGLFALNAATA